MELDRLRQTWHSAHINAPCDSAVTDSAHISRMRGSRQRIIAMERRMAVIGAVMANVIWGIRGHVGISLSVCIAYSLFMLAMTALTIYFIL